jgi:hypothetical protein
MPKGEDWISPSASLIDVYYGGGDAFGTAMFFLNPLIAFGEEFYHGLKYDGISNMMKEIDERAEKGYNSLMNRRMADEVYKKALTENKVSELQYNILKNQYEAGNKPKAPRNSRPRQRRRTQQAPSSIEILIDNNVENKNTSVSG